MNIAQKLFLLFLCASCSPFHPLEVQTQLMTHAYLASYRVGTPDPRLDEPMRGQRLLVHWSLPEKEFIAGETELKMRIRFRNHEEKEVFFPLAARHGTYYYDLMDDEFISTKGILTYFAEVKRGDCTLAVWKHPLWTAWISFPSDENLVLK